MKFWAVGLRPLV